MGLPNIEMAAQAANKTETTGKKGFEKRYILPFVLVTSLFFLWGLANILNSTLISHFQPVFDISRSMALLVETAFYFGYFLVAIPAGLFMEKFGYKKGILLGLVLYATGALLFIPAAETLTFAFFLVALFIIASGLAFLETAANPYATTLGSKETATQRLNLAQSFNGVALVVGPILASQLIFSGNEGEMNSLESKQQAADAVITPYFWIAMAVLFVAFLFFVLKMPEPAKGAKLKFNKAIFKSKHLVKGVIAQFFYVGAQVTIWGLTIDYVIDILPNVSKEVASGTYFAIGTGLFVAGRFVGTFLLSYIKDTKLLALFSVCAIICCLVTVFGNGEIAVYALLAINLFMSIMFPTIFALGVRGLEDKTKLGSSLIIMAIVGGAIIPPIAGLISDSQGIQMAFLLPVICFCVVLYYGVKGYKIKGLDK